MRYKIVIILILCFSVYFLSCCNRNTKRQSEKKVYAIPLTEVRNYIFSDTMNYKMVFIYTTSCESCIRHFDYIKQYSKIKHSDTIKYYFIPFRGNYVFKDVDFDKFVDNNDVIFLNIFENDSCIQTEECTIISGLLQDEGDIFINEGVPQIFIFSPNNILLKIYYEHENDIVITSGNLVDIKGMELSDIDFSIPLRN